MAVDPLSSSPANDTNAPALHKIDIEAGKEYVEDVRRQIEEANQVPNAVGDAEPKAQVGRNITKYFEEERRREAAPAPRHVEISPTLKELLEIKMDAGDMVRFSSEELQRVANEAGDTPLLRYIEDTYGTPQENRWKDQNEELSLRRPVDPEILASAIARYSGVSENVHGAASRSNTAANRLFSEREVYRALQSNGGQLEGLGQELDRLDRNGEFGDFSLLQEEFSRAERYFESEAEKLPSQSSSHDGPWTTNRKFDSPAILLERSFHRAPAPNPADTISDIAQRLKDEIDTVIREQEGRDIKHAHDSVHHVSPAPSRHPSSFSRGAAILPVIQIKHSSSRSAKHVTTPSPDRRVEEEAPPSVSFEDEPFEYQEVESTKAPPLTQPQPEIAPPSPPRSVQIITHPPHDPSTGGSDSAPELDNNSRAALELARQQAIASIEAERKVREQAERTAEKIDRTQSAINATEQETRKSLEELRKLRDDTKYHSEEVQRKIDELEFDVKEKQRKLDRQLEALHELEKSFLKTGEGVSNFIETQRISLMTSSRKATLPEEKEVYERYLKQVSESKLKAEAIKENTQAAISQSRTLGDAAMSFLSQAREVFAQSRQGIQDAEKLSATALHNYEVVAENIHADLLQQTEKSEEIRRTVKQMMKYSDDPSRKDELLEVMKLLDEELMQMGQRAQEARRLNVDVFDTTREIFRSTNESIDRAEVQAKGAAGRASEAYDRFYESFKRTKEIIDQNRDLIERVYDEKLPSAARREASLKIEENERKLAAQEAEVRREAEHSKTSSDNSLITRPLAGGLALMAALMFLVDARYGEVTRTEVLPPSLEQDYPDVVQKVQAVEINVSELYELKKDEEVLRVAQSRIDSRITWEKALGQISHGVGVGAATLAVLLGGSLAISGNAEAEEDKKRVYGVFLKALEDALAEEPNGTSSELLSAVSRNLAKTTRADPIARPLSQLLEGLEKSSLTSEQKRDLLGRVNSLVEQYRDSRSPTMEGARRLALVVAGTTLALSAGFAASDFFSADLQVLSHQREVLQEQIDKTISTQVEYQKAIDAALQSAHQSREKFRRQMDNGDVRAGYYYVELTDLMNRTNERLAQANAALERVDVREEASELLETLSEGYRAINRENLEELKGKGPYALGLSASGSLLILLSGMKWRAKQDRVL